MPKLFFSDIYIDVVINMYIRLLLSTYSLGSQKK